LVAQRAVECGVHRLIVLDLARVGVAQGPSTAALCRDLLARWPQLEITTGGGIRNLDDLRHLQTAGVHGVLLASALHDGSLTADDLKSVRCPRTTDYGPRTATAS
jgi:phosphoribosylformimino-5-aminoimidazole carboxamide ribotide isomerase